MKIEQMYVELCKIEDLVGKLYKKMPDIEVTNVNDHQYSSMFDFIGKLGVDLCNLQLELKVRYTMEKDEEYAAN